MSFKPSTKDFHNEAVAYHLLARLFGIILILGAVLTTQAKAATYNLAILYLPYPVFKR